MLGWTVTMMRRLWKLETWLLYIDGKDEHTKLRYRAHFSLL